jgi:hypothetical protein
MRDWLALGAGGIAVIWAGFSLGPTTDYANVADDLTFCQFDLADVKSALKERSAFASMAQSRWKDWQTWAEDANVARNELQAELERTRSDLLAARLYRPPVAAPEPPEPIVIAIPYPVKKPAPVTRKKRAVKRLPPTDNHWWF